MKTYHILHCTLLSILGYEGDKTILFSKLKYLSTIIDNSSIFAFVYHIFVIHEHGTTFFIYFAFLHRSILFFGESHTITCQMNTSQFENSLIQYLFLLPCIFDSQWMKRELRTTLCNKY